MEVWGQTGKASARRKSGLALSPAHWLSRGAAPEVGDSHLEPDEQAPTTPERTLCRAKDGTPCQRPAGRARGDTAGWGRGGAAAHVPAALTWACVSGLQGPEG